MDPRNERKVFEMMASVATISGTSQYFLITPKLLPALDYNDKMNILGIFNGEGLEDNDKDDLDQSFAHDKVIERVKFRNSQLTQSQAGWTKHKGASHLFIYQILNHQNCFLIL